MDTLVIPSGGVVNFKGTTSASSYVNQVCFTIAPHWDSLNTTIDGWVFQCYNGIANCGRKVNDAYAADPTITPLTTETNVDNCLADERYLNYRVQTFYYTTPTSS